jgi:hypothetical protein
VVVLDLCFVGKGRQCTSSENCVIEIVNKWEDRLPLSMVASLHEGNMNLVGEYDAGAAASSRHAAGSA